MSSKLRMAKFFIVYKIYWSMPAQKDVVFHLYFLLNHPHTKFSFVGPTSYFSFAIIKMIYKWN